MLTTRDWALVIAVLNTYGLQRLLVGFAEAPLSVIGSDVLSSKTLYSLPANKYIPSHNNVINKLHYACVTSEIMIYCISLKSHHTSKSCRPQNVAAYFSQHIPITPPSKSRRMVRGRRRYPHAHAHYTCIQIGLLLKLCTCVRIDLHRRRPRNLATLELSPHGRAPWNKISPRLDFEEIRYVSEPELGEKKKVWASSKQHMLHDYRTPSHDLKLHVCTCADATEWPLNWLS